MEKLNTRYGYIYKITNKVNGKIYVGKRKGSEFDEEYWGSGKKIKKALEEFGTRSFERKILEWCSTNDILKAREKYWINQLQSCNPEIGYNIAVGGVGGDSTTIHLNQSNSKIIGFQIPGVLINCLEKEAKDCGMTISALLRNILAKRYKNLAKFSNEEESK